MTDGPRSVLHVVWEYPPVIYGGLGRHAEQLTRAQHLAGMDVEVLTAAEDVTAPGRRVAAGSTVRRGVLVHRARRRSPRLPWSDLLGSVAQLEAAFTEAGEVPAARADVVHAHDWIGSRAAARLAARAGLPLVLTVHATEWGRHQGRVEESSPGSDGVSARVHQAERAGVTAADAVVVCSTAMREEVCSVLAADPAKVHVVPNAVEAATWRSGRSAVREARRYWLRTAEAAVTGPGPASGGQTAGGPAAGTVPDDGPLVVAAGRLEWEKGFSTLIRAMPSLRRQFPGLRVVLAGRGSYAGRLSELAGELGVLDRLVLPGWLASRDLAALYAASDAVVVPSRYEPSGLVAREAQAAGAVVVVTDVGGLTDAVLDGRTGLRVGVGDVHALHDALASLARDPVRAHALADAGRAGVQQLTWATAATATRTVYRATRRGDHTINAGVSGR